MESESTVMVARLVDNELWYYGLYDTWDRAEKVAKELGNGVAFEIDTENINADMVAMLTEIQLEIEELWDNDSSYIEGVYDAEKIIQQKIEQLKEK